MEFFAEINNKQLNKNHLKEKLSIARLAELCGSIDEVILDNIDNGRIYCVWGEFEVNRETLEYGIRFSLPHCPNALAWTITCDEENSKIIIHCTINKKQHDTDFIESIEKFVTDWQLNDYELKVHSLHQ